MPSPEIEAVIPFTRPPGRLSPVLEVSCCTLHHVLVISKHRVRPVLVPAPCFSVALFKVTGGSVAIGLIAHRKNLPRKFVQQLRRGLRSFFRLTFRYLPRH